MSNRTPCSPKWGLVKIVDAHGTDEKSEFLDRSLVEVFCNLTREQVNSIPFLELGKILEVLSEALTEEVPSLINRFELNGVEYGFVPNIEEIKTNAYIDAESGMADWGNMHQAIASLYRPITHTRSARGVEQYEIEKYIPTATKVNEMLNAPVDVVMSVRVFFWTLNKELLETTLRYLTQHKKEMTKEELLVMNQLSQRSGGGINQFTALQEEVISDLTKLQVARYFQR